MKRIGLLIFFICIILFSLFIRRKEGFLTTGGATVVTASFYPVANIGAVCSNLCFNKKNNTLYVATNSDGTIRSVSLSGQIAIIMHGNTVVSGTTTKLSLNNSTDDKGPWGICCDSNGNMYVGDQKNQKIYMIPYDTITASSCSPRLFASVTSRPMGMACDSSNNVYVACGGTGNGGVYKFDSNGNSITTYTIPGSAPMCVGIDSSDNMYTSACTGGAGLYMFPRDSTSSTVIVPSFPTYILGLIISPNGIIYASGTGSAGIISVFQQGATPKIGDIQIPGPAAGQGLCFDNSGNLYVATKNNFIHKYVPKVQCKPNSSYSLTGDPPCTPCPTTNLGTCPFVGTPTCATNYELNTTTGTTCDPKPCTAGVNFSVSGNMPCTACPANATCSGTTPAGITCATNYTIANSGTVNAVCNPTPCTTGTYSSSGKAPCQTCPVNNATCGIAGTPTCQTNLQYDSLTNTCKPIPCTAGNYSATGNQPCTACPTTNLGTCGTTGTPTCASGYTLSATGTQCLIAPAQCPIGTYSSTGQTPVGSTTCPSQCPAGYTTTSTGASNINQCVRPITPQDVITWLNTNNYNIITPTATTSLPANAKYYGLQTTDLTNFPTTSIPTVASGATYSGSLASIEPLLNSAITSAALTNYANKSLATFTNAYYLTNSQGQAVNGSNVTVKYPMTSIPFSKGSLENQTKNILSCTSMTDPKSCTYKWAGTSGPISANPCPALNSWFDFDQSACVDALGKKITSSNVCSSSSVYNQTTNACVAVRTPVKTMPPNTMGSLGTDDYNNCKTIDQGDCTVIYKLGSNVTTTNPCSGSTPNYNFETHACVGNPCCSLTASQAAANPSCAQYVQSVNAPNASCTNPTTAVARTCCQPANASKPQCASYYTKTNSFKQSHSNLCGTSGFEDYMQQFVLTGPPRIKYF